MITRIELKNVASYDDRGAIIEDMGKVNFLYGTNGSGKTTISRYLHSTISDAPSTDFSDCRLESNNGCELIVYNQDFKNRIYQATELPGIFTIGESTIEQLNKIDQLKKEKRNGSDDLTTRRRTLDEKKAEENEILKEYRDIAWEIFKDYDKDFQEVFTGLRNKKERFLDELRNRYKKTPDVQKNDNNVNRENLVETYASLFGRTPQTIVEIPPINFSKIIEIEEDPIWNQAVIGNKDVDIAGLIEHLQNADWVKTGLRFVEDQSDVCPFCQKHTIDEQFRTQLEQYFDERFQEEIKLIDTLINDYQQESNFISQEISDLATNPKANKDKINSLYTQFKAHKDKVLSIMSNKKEKPSMQSEIAVGKALFNKVCDYIEETNQLIDQNNQLASNIQDEKNQLIYNVWSHLLLSRDTAIQQFETRLDNVQKAIKGMTESICKGEELLDQITTVRFNFPKVAGRDNRTVYLNYYCH